MWIKEIDNFNLQNLHQNLHNSSATTEILDFVSSSSSKVNADSSLSHDEQESNSSSLDNDYSMSS